MPIYEYECKKCGFIFESLQKIEDQNPSCPKCESDETQKRITAPNTHSKGDCGQSQGKRFS